MRSTSVLSFLAAALVAAPLASVLAEEPKAVTIPARDTWKVGDVVTKKSSETKKQKQAIKDAEGNAIPGQGGETEEKVEYEAVIKVLAANAEGRATKKLVYFKAWSRTEDGKNDTSLTGKHVNVEGEGAATKATLAGGTASEEVAKWLDDEFGKAAAKNDEKNALLVPDKPVTPGTSWDLPMAKLIAAMDTGPMKFLAEKSTGKVTLVETMGDVGQLKMEISLQAGPMDTPMGAIDWKSGGAFQMSAEMVKSLNPAEHGEMGKMSGKFSGTAGNEALNVEIDMTMEGEMTVEPGGEMPEIK
jgi:hypothetical protein